MAAVLAVTVVGAHVGCDRCGATAYVDRTPSDAFTARILDPLAAWWVAHEAPRLVMVEVLANGELQEWRAA